MLYVHTHTHTQIFAICAFATTTNFSNELTANCAGTTKTLPIEYPFKFDTAAICESKQSFSFASDAQFFVATGVLSLMYCLFIIAVHLFIDDFYKSKSEIPLADFMLTTILAIFWLSGSAAWSNGTTGLKSVLEPEKWQKMCPVCTDFSVSSFARLNISLVSTHTHLVCPHNKMAFHYFWCVSFFFFCFSPQILGFLNFFLWASDLWFLYKETIWFQGRRVNNASTPNV